VSDGLVQGRTSRATVAVPSRAEGRPADVISPDLVMLIADKVYALWLAEARVARERQRWPAQAPFMQQGGS
jgi:hypothetical protein